MTSFTSLLKHVPGIYRRLCLPKKALSRWPLKAERSHRHQRNDQQAACSLPASTGTSYPCSQVTECHTSPEETQVGAGSSSQSPLQLHPVPAQLSTHRASPDSTLHSSSPAPPPQSTLNILNFHRRGICKSSSSQAHAPADFTNLLSTFARWIFSSLLGKGWDNGATNRKNARNGLSYWGAPVLSPKM